LPRLRIRLAERRDTDALRAIEVAAGEPFRALGMDSIADDEPPAASALHSVIDDGRAWVSVDEVDRPIGYLLVEIVGGSAHIGQVSVDPTHAGLRIGSALIDVAGQWAVEHRLAGLTLTTFTDVPWNAPYYQRLGFEAIPPDQVTRELRELAAAELEYFQHRWPRVAMRRAL